jgi:hypothetical protein
VALLLLLLLLLLKQKPSVPEEVESSEQLNEQRLDGRDGEARSIGSEGRG